VLRLKLYSDEEVPQSKFDRLKGLLSFDTDKIDLMTKEMIAAVHSEEPRDQQLDQLASSLGIKRDRLSGYLSVFREAVLRILAGKSDEVVQQDLVQNGIAESKVKFLFSSVGNLPQGEKEAIKYWAMEVETIGDRNHIHGMGVRSDFISAIDNGNIVAMLPVSILDLVISVKEKDEELKCQIQESLSGLTALIAFLEEARGELEKATLALKSKLGETVVSTSGGGG
jgi:hypothetical protein